MTMVHGILGAVLLATSVAARPIQAQDGSTWAVLIGGLGGDPAYTERFADHLLQTRTQLIERHGVPANQITVLGESSVADRPHVNDVSTAENIEATFARLERRVNASDQLLVVLFGHGSYDGTHSRLNIPRQDLTDADFAALIGRIAVARTVVVNTGSASGPFTRTLAGDNRIIIVATASGSQRDATIFPEYFVDALRSPETDLDRDGATSMREVFVHAASNTLRHYEDAGRIVTEHAVLEDDGDGEGTRLADLDGASDGHLAGVTTLRPSRAFTAENLPLLQERQELERAIASTKQRKATMSDDAYYAALERLFIELARLNRRIDETSQTN